MPGTVDPRYVALATRCRAIRVELDRLNDSIMLLSKDERGGLDHDTAILRDVLDTLEVDIEARAASL
jgi:hypothetical protein